MPSPRKTTGAKTATKKSAARKPANDAIALLTEDHHEVSKLFETYATLVEDDAAAEERLEVAQQICECLTAHATIEEEIFYPAMREALEEDDLLDEAEVEHASAKDLIAQIESMDPDDDLYDAKVKVLGEYVEHHVKEEESEMFVKAAKAKLDLEDLGLQLMARKSELVARVEQEDV